MKIVPVMTEKSLNLAQKKGKYTFFVPIDLTKPAVKKLIGEIFKVHVREIQTQSYKARIKTNIYRKKVGVRAQKKVTVTLKDKEKIDLFQSEKKKS